MSDYITSLGITLYGAAAEPATYDKAGFDAVSWTEIGGVSNIGGTLGATFESVSFVLLKTGIDAPEKGTVNYGEMTVTVGRDVTDAGQILIKAGLDGAEKLTNHSWKLRMANGDYLCMTGKIFSAPNTLGDANTTIVREINIKANNELLEFTTP